MTQWEEKKKIHVVTPRETGINDLREGEAGYFGHNDTCSVRPMLHQIHLSGMLAEL